VIGDTTLPCGCLIGNRMADGERMFVIEPCAVKCPNYLLALRVARERGVAPEFHPAEDVGMRRKLAWPKR
jgi:hypothetical protein